MYDVEGTQDGIFFRFSEPWTVNNVRVRNAFAAILSFKTFYAKCLCNKMPATSDFNELQGFISL